MDPWWYLRSWPYPGSGCLELTATGVIWGGSSDPGNTVGNGAQETIIQDVVITGFNRGVRYGNNNYNTKLEGARSYDNKIELIEPVGLNASGEDLRCLLDVRQCVGQGQLRWVRPIQ